MKNNILCICLVLSLQVFSQDSAWPGLDIGSLSCSGSPYNYSGNTTGANNDCSVESSGDHMYQFTLTVAADITIDLCGSSFDTKLYLYDLSNGNCNAGSIASNDDACSLQSSIMQTGLAAGTYVVVVEGYSGAEGAYDINFDVSNCQNSGDEPCDAIGVGVGCGSKTISSNSGKTNSGVTSPSCGSYAGDDVWFETTIPASGELDIDIVSVLSGISDIGVASYIGSTCSGTLTEVSCTIGSDPSFNLIGLTAGDILYTRVWENGNDQTGQFEVEITDPTTLFCLYGDATMYNYPTDTCMQVTADVSSQRGCAWYQNTLDFTSSFDHTLEVYLGDHDGGDGMTFVFHNDPDGTNDCGASGAGLGASGLDNALVIEVDTYDNDDPWHTWDLAEDHIAVWTTSSGYTNPIAGPVEATGSNTDIEDGAIHTLRLVWNATTNTLEVYFDSVFRLSVTDDFVANVFGSKNVFWGSTGSTGGVTNQMYVCPPAELITPVLSLDVKSFTVFCDGDEVGFHWGTYRNLSAAYFEILGSKDGVNYQSISFVNASEKRNYNVSVPNKGFKFYVLKQKDFDGSEYYSELKKLDCSSDIDVLVLTDNTYSNWMFEFMNCQDQTVSIEVFSLNGSALSKINIQNENRFNLDISSLPKGIYFVKIVVGNVVRTKKMII